MKTNKTNRLHFIFLLAVLGATLEFWWPIIALYLANVKTKCTVRCSVRYYSARKWEALPFFLQDLQFPSARDFLWGTANSAAKEACCFHWVFVSQKPVFSDTHVRRILLLCLLDEEKKTLPLLNRCEYVKYVFLSLSLSLSFSIFTSIHLYKVNPNFTLLQLYIPFGVLLLKVRNTYRLSGVTGKKQANAFLLPLPNEFVLCGCRGYRAAGAQGSIAASMARNWWLLLLYLLKERSLIRQWRRCRWSESSSLSITCKYIN